MKTVKNYIYSSLYQLFLIIVPFATIPYVSRVLGAELIGVNNCLWKSNNCLLPRINNEAKSKVLGNPYSKIGCFISYLPHVLSFYLVIP